MRKALIGLGLLALSTRAALALPVDSYQITTREPGQRIVAGCSDTKWTQWNITLNHRFAHPIIEIGRDCVGDRNIVLDIDQDAIGNVHAKLVAAKGMEFDWLATRSRPMVSAKKYTGTLLIFHVQDDGKLALGTYYVGSTL